MKTSDILNKAADLIETRGWRGFGELGDEDSWGGGASSDAPVCLEGGILAAMGLSTVPDGRFTDIVHTPDGFRDCPAMKAVSAYLATSVPFVYNDAEGRTASEVIETLRAAAVIEAARESESARVSL